MARRYEIGKGKDLRFTNTEYYFFAKVYDAATERKVGEFKDNCPWGLARKVLGEFELEIFKGDTVTSKEGRKIGRKSLGEFPVSDEELIEFYMEFHGTSLLRATSKNPKII